MTDTTPALRTAATAPGGSGGETLGGPGNPFAPRVAKLRAAVSRTR